MKLTFPGAWPSLGNMEQETSVFLLFSGLQSALEEAHAALLLFENTAAVSAFDSLHLYRRKLPFVFAKAFILPAFLASAMLEALSKTQPQIKRCLKSLRSAVPGLEDVRDSIQHAEDRILGVKKGKQITLKPVSNRLVSAPSGGVVIIDGLNGNRYGITCADGSYREIEISQATLQAILDCAQAAIDSLTWKGESINRELPPPEWPRR